MWTNLTKKDTTKIRSIGNYCGPVESISDSEFARQVNALPLITIRNEWKKDVLGYGNEIRHLLNVKGLSPDAVFRIFAGTLKESSKIIVVSLKNNKAITIKR